MQAFVLLTFDTAGEAAVREIQADLKRSDLLPSTKSEQALAPHLTLAGFEAFDFPTLVEALTDALDEVLSFPVTFASLGAFVGENRVLFLAPVITKPLLALHERIYTAVSANVQDNDARYAPEAWIPHCTLAMELTDSHLAEGIRHLSRLDLPLQAHITRVQLVTYPELSVLAAWSLETSW